MNALENKLCEIYGSKYAYFTGNATTALYLIFKSLNIRYKKVLFPNITCMAPVNAAIYAGYEVIFCDVNKNDYTIDIDALKNIIRNDSIGVVVPTHIYGHVCDMKEIYEVCKSNDVLVIEDAAQTIGISKYNDYAVTSFGHTKILETELGGGVIFYKESAIKDFFDKYAKGLKDNNDKELSEQYSKEYYRITKNLNGQKYYEKMRKLQYNSRNVFLGHFKDNIKLSSLLDKKDDILKSRYERVQLYLENLDQKYFEFPKINFTLENPLWRMTVIVKNLNRNAFVDEVRKNNIDISTWYPNLHKFYTEQNDQEFKNSIFISDNLVNFWVSEKYSLIKIKHDIDIINKIAQNMCYS